MPSLSATQAAGTSTDPCETSLFQAQPDLAGRDTSVPAQVSKRALDLLLAVTGLVVLSVLFAMIAAAILAMEGRPIFFRHRRIGRHGKSFDCLKFRTMARNSESRLARYLSANPAAMKEWQATQKLKSDPRVTPLGRVLRSTSIDELPQLINIIRGEMSIVGPRPIVSDEVARYGAAIAEYCSVRPGLTGPWQCGGRNDISYEYRVMLDTKYVRSWSFGTDLAIIVKTIPAVLATRGVY